MPWKHVRYYNSFSQAHSLIYSVIGVQELNLNFFYNKTYWATACLTVESGSVDETLNEIEAQKR